MGTEAEFQNVRHSLRCVCRMCKGVPSGYISDEDGDVLVVLCNFHLEKAKRTLKLEAIIWKKPGNGL